MTDPAALKALIRLAHERGQAERSLEDGGTLRVEVDPDSGAMSTMERGPDGAIRREGRMFPGAETPPDGYPPDWPFLSSVDTLVWRDAEGVVLVGYQTDTAEGAGTAFGEIERRLVDDGWTAMDRSSSSMLERCTFERDGRRRALSRFSLGPTPGLSLSRLP